MRRMVPEPASRPKRTPYRSPATNRVVIEVEVDNREEAAAWRWWYFDGPGEVGWRRHAKKPLRWFERFTARHMLVFAWASLMMTHLRHGEYWRAAGALVLVLTSAAIIRLGEP